MDKTRRMARCLVVDDEPLAITLVSGHIQQVEGLEIVACCKNALQALEVLRKEQVDLIFLDICMPQLSGLDFLRTLTHPPRVILTTAYREFALEGFELDVIDYLLKPIAFERFLKSVNKYFERIGKPDSPYASTLAFPDDDFILVRDNRMVYKINYKDILYIEAYGEYMKIHTRDKVHLSRETMHELENKLPRSLFIRIHKSFIVPLQKITAFSTISVHIQNQEIPLGRSYKDHVLEVLNGK